MMRSGRHVRAPATGQRGFSIISAIFLLVVLSALGAAMLNLSGAQHTSSALDIDGTRAYHAARSGIEWGLYKVANPPATACFGSPSSFAPPAPTLAAFTVTVTCTPFTTGGVTVFQIQTTACNRPLAGNCPGAGGTTYYVERQLQATVGN